MSGLARQHDRELLDALKSYPSEAFSGETWRVTAKGRDALRGSTAGGRWSPPGEFEVLYTSLARAGGLDEIGYRLSLEPVWPSRLEHELHRITARTNHSLRFADVSSLSTLGVDVRRYASFEYSSNPGNCSGRLLSRFRRIDYTERAKYRTQSGNLRGEAWHRRAAEA